MKRIAAVILVVMAGGLGRAGAAAEAGGIGIRPQTAGDWFRIELAPGEEARDTALVTNSTGERLEVVVYPVDATITPQGGFALRERADARTGIGSWVRLDAERLAVLPQSSVRVPFRLSLPDGVEPGDYAGGIVIEKAPRAGDVSEVGENLAVQVNIVERMGVRIYLHVAGTINRRLHAGTLAWERTKSGIDFTLPVRNAGNVRVQPRATLRITGAGAPRSALAMRGPDELLPGTSGVLRAQWRTPPGFSFFSAEATIDFGAAASLDRRATGRLIPWPAVALALLVLLLAAFIAWRAARFVTRARRALQAVEKRQDRPRATTRT